MLKSHKILFLKIVAALIVLFVLYGVFLGPHHGQELVKNAPAGSIATELQWLRSDIKVFAEKYHYLPGDLPNTKKTLSKCKACKSGNGDGVISENEASQFWTQLYATEILREDFKKTTALNGMISVKHFEGALPQAKSIKNANGNFLVLSNVNGGKTEDAAFLLGNQALYLDKVLDDGFPSTGRIIAAGRDTCFKKNSDDTVEYKIGGRDLCAFFYFKMEELNMDKKTNGRTH